MLAKNVNYGDAIDITVDEFGSGNILISTGYNAEERIGACSFKNQDQRPISEINEKEKGRYMKEYGIDFLMQFTKPESLDVLIEMLIDLRTKYNN